MLVSTDNRMGRAMDWPDLAPDSIALVTDVSAPGTDYQNASYGMNGGLGDVITDVTTGNWSALPTDFVNGLNPATLDIGSYLILGIGLYLFMPKLFKGGGSRRAYASARRKAGLTGQIAADQTLLKAAS